MLFNLYVDGSWLFRQCEKNGILAKHLEFADSCFRLDFSRLLRVLETSLSSATGEAVSAGQLYLYTAIFQVPDNVDPARDDIGRIVKGSCARRHFIDAALDAGFSDEGIFEVPLRPWMLQRVREGRYQEKMVDTALVTRLVEQSIREPQRLHVLLSGDTDMLPAVQILVPEYTDRVVLLTTHPHQYGPADGQSSLRLNQFAFRYEPIYLERHTEAIVQGEHVYRCSNPDCQKVIVRRQPIPASANPICKPCHERRAA